MASPVSLESITVKLSVEGGEFVATPRLSVSSDSPTSSFPAGDGGFVTLPYRNSMVTPAGEGNDGVADGRMECPTNTSWMECPTNAAVEAPITHACNRWAL